MGSVSSRLDGVSLFLYCCVSFWLLLVKRAALCTMSCASFWRLVLSALRVIHMAAGGAVRRMVGKYYGHDLSLLLEKAIRGLPAVEACYNELRRVSDAASEHHASDRRSGAGPYFDGPPANMLDLQWRWVGRQSSTSTGSRGRGESESTA